MTRVAWFLGNWIAQIVFAFRIGYRDGSVLRHGTRPEIFRDSRSAAGGQS